MVQSPTTPVGLSITQTVASSVSAVVQTQQSVASQSQQVVADSQPQYTAEQLAQIAIWDLYYQAVRDYNDPDKTGYYDPIRGGGFSDGWGPPLVPPHPDPRVGFMSPSTESLSHSLDNLYAKTKEDITGWFQIITSRDHQSMRKGDPGYRSVGKGLIAGIDKALSPKESVGISLCYNKIQMMPYQSLPRSIVSTYMLMGNGNRPLLAGLFFSELGTEIEKLFARRRLLEER